MSSDEAWDGIKEDLSQLLEDSTLALFHPLIADLQRWSSAKRYAPDFFRASIKLIQQIDADAQCGRPVYDVLKQVMLELNQATEGSYIQPNWNVGNVIQTHGNIFQFVLDRVYDEIKFSEPKPGTPVPIVLLVMTAIEAQELILGTAFNGYPDQLRADFEHLRKLLEENNLVDWVNRYKDIPEVWQPFSSIDSTESIEQLVTQAINEANKAGNYEQPLFPSFKNIRTLNDPANRRYLRDLRNEGCVVIVDSISMHHPSLQRTLLQSSLDVYPKTAVVTMAPIHSIIDFMREITIIFHLRISDMEFAKRVSDQHEDYGMCEEIWHKRKFEHWLLDRVRKMHPSGSSIRPYMHKSLGDRQ